MRRIDADKVHKKINDEIEIAFKDYIKARGQSTAELTTKKAIELDGYLRGLYWAKNKINCTKTLKSDENYWRTEVDKAYHRGFEACRASTDTKQTQVEEYGYNSLTDMYSDMQFLKAELVETRREAAAYKKLLIDNKII